MGNDLASLSYVSVDEVVAGIIQRWRVAKMDIRQAYRNVPIHQSDRPLLGMLWQGETFADATLPFGLRSAPLIFSAIADALWSRWAWSGLPTTLMILSLWELPAPMNVQQMLC